MTLLMASKASAESNEKIELEIELARKAIPLKDEYNIMFWRPQKVGSSTILSILTSYSFRYNILSRRRGAVNSLCIRLGRCILEDFQNSTSASSTSSPSSSSIFTSFSSAPSNIATRMKIKEVKSLYHDTSILSESREIRAESVPYRIVASHQLCAIDAELTRQYLLCAFTDRNIFNKKQLHESSLLPSPQSIMGSTFKELFVVRDPLNRAISIYYFWGELFKLKAEKMKSRG